MPKHLIFKLDFKIKMLLYRHGISICLNTGHLFSSLIVLDVKS